MSIRFLLLVLLFGSVSSQADCQQDQRSMTYCTKQDYKASEKELKSTFDSQMSYLTSQISKDRFTKSHDDWIKFRESSCLYEVGLRSEGGSSWKMKEAICLTRINKERVITLNKYKLCRDAGCPE